MSYHKSTREAAKGKWRGILLEFGFEANVLRNRHGLCPICAKSDGFRWDDKDGSGSYICTCGSGDGFHLIERVTGRDFRSVAPEIDAMVGNLTPDTPQPRRDMTEADRRAALVKVWQSTAPIAPGDMAHRYLETRGVGGLIYPKALRYGRAIADGEGGVRPCMVALIGVHGEPKLSSMHRTFLRHDGSGKADMASPRKLMPGDLPDAACVMLSDWMGTGAIGIAEGIETALSASAMYDMPVWAAINSAMLKRWHPPHGCEEVAIFGDNDRKYGGQAAAYALAHKLSVKNITVSVHIPPMTGQDWNDVLMKRTA